MSGANGPLECTEEELTALALLAGRPRFPGVSGAAFAGHEATSREALLRAGRRSLVVRGLVAVSDDGSAMLIGQHEPVLRVALSPEVFLSALHRNRDGGEMRLFLAHRDLALEQMSPLPSIYRLTPFEPAALLDHVTGFLGLESRSGSKDEAIETTTQELARAHAEPGAAADPRVARLIENHVRTATVRCLHGQGRILGGELAWMDAGRQGLWRLASAQREGQASVGQRVTLRPTTAASIVEQLTGLLPADD